MDQNPLTHMFETLHDSLVDKISDPKKLGSYCIYEFVIFIASLVVRYMLWVMQQNDKTGQTLHLKDMILISSCFSIEFCNSAPQNLHRF